MRQFAWYNIELDKIVIEVNVTTEDGCIFEGWYDYGTGYTRVLSKFTWMPLGEL